VIENFTANDLYFTVAVFLVFGIVCGYILAWTIHGRKSEAEKRYLVALWEIDKLAQTHWDLHPGLFCVIRAKIKRAYFGPDPGETP
jgi:hypothetical protein